MLYIMLYLEHPDVIGDIYLTIPKCAAVSIYLGVVIKQLF